MGKQAAALSNTFKKPDIKEQIRELKFFNYYNEKRKPNFRFGTLVLGILYFAFCIFYFVGFPLDTANVIVAVMCGLLAIASFILFALTFRRPTIFNRQDLLSTALLAGCLFMLTFTWGSSTSTNSADTQTITVVYAFALLFHLPPFQVVIIMCLASLPVLVVTFRVDYVNSSFWNRLLTVNNLCILGQFGAATVFGVNYMKSLAKREFASLVADQRTQRRMQARQRKNQRLLKSLFPPAIRAMVEGSEAHSFPNAIVVFGDMESFGDVTAGLSPKNSIDVLNKVFALLDARAEHHSILKIKTTGDMYLAVANVPEATPTGILDAISFALDGIEGIQLIASSLTLPLRPRFGIHVGQIIGGVLKTSKIAFDVWGDTVNVAHRMMSHGEPGAVQVSRDVMAHLPPSLQTQLLGALLDPRHNASARTAPRLGGLGSTRGENGPLSPTSAGSGEGTSRSAVSSILSDVSTIQLEMTDEMVQRTSMWSVHPRGAIQIKHHGSMECYLVTRTDRQALPLPPGLGGFSATAPSQLHSTPTTSNANTNTNAHCASQPTTPTAQDQQAAVNITHTPPHTRPSSAASTHADPNTSMSMSMCMTPTGGAAPSTSPSMSMGEPLSSFDPTPSPCFSMWSSAPGSGSGSTMNPSRALAAAQYFPSGHAKPAWDQGSVASGGSKRSGGSKSLWGRGASDVASTSSGSSDTDILGTIRQCMRLSVAEDGDEAADGGDEDEDAECGEQDGHAEPAAFELDERYTLHHAYMFREREQLIGYWRSSRKQTLSRLRLGLLVALSHIAIDLITEVCFFPYLPALCFRLPALALLGLLLGFTWLKQWALHFRVQQCIAGLEAVFYLVSILGMWMYMAVHQETLTTSRARSTTTAYFIAQMSFFFFNYFSESFPVGSYALKWICATLSLGAVCAAMFMIELSIDRLILFPVLVFVSALMDVLFMRTSRAGYLRQQALSLLIRAAQQQGDESSRLLESVLPPAVLERLKRNPRALSRLVPEATVVLADFVGFTTLCSAVPAIFIVRMLEQIYSRFDAICSEKGLTSIATIGDCYFAGAGVITTDDHHATNVTQAALNMVDAVRCFAREQGIDLKIRVGVGTGPVFSGVLGSSRYTFDVWGPAVDEGHAMEASSRSNRVHISGHVKNLLSSSQFSFHRASPWQKRETFYVQSSAPQTPHSE